MITTTPELFHALATTPVLTGTSLYAQNLIAEEGTVRDFAAGQIIVHEGQEGHAFFILVCGEVEVFKRAGTPEEVVLCKLKEGEFFGEMCILAPMNRAASIRASRPARVIEIKAATLYHLYQKIPDQYAIVLLNLARDLARRLCHIDEAYAARAI
ncbi:MAG TPA: cyclic nucleotide-binding domain-containing protein [Candidatus Methylacidiphilales bacterium]|jgi:CRP-like cAMP-binding protein|nr:cyclic nucleotide-binding domain-containing protein [Candidatus Methylacidiphilales bacterium]